MIVIVYFACVKSSTSYSGSLISAAVNKELLDDEDWRNLELSNNLDEQTVQIKVMDNHPRDYSLC